MKKRASLASGPLAQAKNAIRGHPREGKASVLNAIDFARRTLPRGDIREFVRWTSKAAPGIRAHLLLRPRTAYREILNYFEPPPIDLERELIWALAIVECGSSEISYQLTRSRNITELVLRGEWAAAENVLDDIESRVGQTLWGISLRMYLLQKSKGLEFQKSFAQQVRNACPGKLASAFAFTTSERNEDAIAIGRYIERMRGVFNSFEKRPAIRDFFLYAALGDDSDKPEFVSNVLRVASRTSLIDLYHATVWGLEQLVVTNWLAHRDVVCSALGKAVESIDDPRTKRISALMNDVFGEQDGSRFQLENEFCLGNDVGVIGQFPEALKRGLPSTRHLLFFVRSEIKSGITGDLDSSFLREICDKIKCVLEKKNGWREMRDDLLQLSLNARALPFFGVVQDLLREAELLGAGDLRRSALRSSYETNGIGHEIALVRRNMDVVPTWRERSWKDGAYASYSAIICGLETHANCRLSPQREAEALALRGLVANDPELIDRAADRLESICEESARLYAGMLRARACLYRGDFCGALEVVADNCVGRPDLAVLFPLRDMLQGASWADISNYRSKIALAIVLDLFVRESGDRRQSVNLRIAFDEFLIANRIVRPSKIHEVFGSGNPKHIEYFLRYVCVPNVMDISLVFASSREIDEERANIVSLLSEGLSDGSSELREELLEITRRLVIRDGLRTIDQSRVFVDTEALKQLAVRELSNVFERYKTLKEIGLGGTSDGFNEALSHALATNGKSDEVFSQVPSGQGDALLVDVVIGLSNVFLENPEHGLEYFLSTRIRHGSLSGHLRGAMEARGMLLVRDDVSGTYQSNSRFAEVLYLESEQQEVVDSALAEFSREVDQIISEVTSDLLHARSAAKPRGLFFLEINAPVLHGIKEAIDKDSAFDRFVDTQFALFWTMLEPRLAEARDVLKSVVRQRVLDALERLIAALSRELAPWQFRNASNSIGEARTEFQAAIQTVVEWFQPVESRSLGESYLMDQVLDIAIEVTKNVRRDFQPRVERAIAVQTQIAATSLPTLIDTMFIVFDNARKHGGAGPNPRIWVHASEDATREGVALRIRSECGEGVRSEELEEKLQRLRQVISSDRHKHLMKAEGGTGFLKLRRIATARGPQALKFGFVDECYFEVEILLPVRWRR